MTGVVYTASAQEDLLAAWLFIAERNPTAADRVLETIEEEAQMLGQHPLMGRARPELPHAVRSWATSTPFILFYLPGDYDITVLRVLHHARDVVNISF